MSWARDFAFVNGRLSWMDDFQQRQMRWKIHFAFILLFIHSGEITVQRNKSVFAVRFPWTRDIHNSMNRKRLSLHLYETWILKNVIKKVSTRARQECKIVMTSQRFGFCSISFFLVAEVFLSFRYRQTRSGHVFWSGSDARYGREKEMNSSSMEKFRAKPIICRRNIVWISAEWYAKIQKKNHFIVSRRIC